ncbi:DNA polymerase [Methanosarcina sp. 2.H.A.1B.4]|nr:DNA polymerase [Methanosarcina sp. 2.H.A.1B.4]
MSKVAVRGYTQRLEKKGEYRSFRRYDTPLRHNRVLVFDTETTINQYQNFKIGYFQIYQDGVIQHDGLFYDPSTLNERETKILEAYSRKHNISLYSLDEFIDNVFYPEVFGLKTLCNGYNLAFDISRISKRSGDSRGRNRGGFTLTLSDDPFKPPVIIRKLGYSNSFKFTTTKQNKGEIYFSGYFLDTQRLAEVLLQERRISLEKAAERLNTPVQKMKGIEHGKVTEKYIDYLIKDVETTHAVYEKLVKELDVYQIHIPITKIFSEASIGKHALSQLGVKPFLALNPDFPDSVIGNMMTSYFGGRTECKIRKEPTKVTVLDFTSMYPTVTMLMNLWKYIIAESLEIQDITEEVRRFISNLKLSDLQKQDTWKKLVVMVKIQPDNDIFPVRMDYKGDNTGLNVGINYLSSTSEMWYSLPDIIGSYLLTGKVPKIIEAVKFVPKGVQKGLRKSRVLGINIDPLKDNVVQVLVEERQRIKQELKKTDRNDPEFQHLSSRAQAIKILVNALSYGIFIELNPEDKKSEFQVYGLENFITKENRFEKSGKYFHPLLAVMITSGARLFLTMAEARLKELGAIHAYMDTDSVFVPPEKAQELVEFFQPLNPYNMDIPLLKPEKKDLWFYGIASKRYALYYYENGKIGFMGDERSYKLHGLGHLTNPFPNSVEDWQAEIWQDILKLHYRLITERDIEEKYSNLYAISRLTVSTSNVLNRFKKLNNGKLWKEQIKPFNFFLVGFQAIEENDKAIKPLAPFTKDYQKIVYDPFIDYETGEVKEGSKYFKPLSRTILQYVEHMENKFEGTIGVLKRKHIQADGLVYIGKEANNIEDQPLDVTKSQVFINEEEIRQKILALTPEEARKKGIKHRSTLKRMKDRIQNEAIISLRTKSIKKLIMDS